MPDHAVRIPSKVKELRMRSKNHRDKAEKFNQEAMDIMLDQTRHWMREMDDKLLNRNECLDYLSISTLQSLKSWEREYSTHDYLQFENNKTLRSELIRFIDDYNSVVIHKKINQSK